MKRIGYTGLATVAAMMCAALAFATPAPNSATIETRIFNDCPTSTLSSTNLYPALVSITDVMNPACVGFANLHVWALSEDGINPALFVNSSHFSLSADVTISGDGEGEGGMRFSPWYTHADGRFMINASTGEIACFSGRVPFYTFTGGQGLTYVKGTTVKMEIIYLANGLNSGSPATLEYKYTDGSGTYSSGALAYDEGNTTEAVHGLWGNTHDSTAGGYFQPRANTGEDLTATWANITFTNLDVVSTQKSSWGRIKSLYR
jgi:hypothetical protein